MTKEITIEAKVEKLQEVLDFIEQHLAGAGCPMKTQTQIAIAAEEIFVNIASYAYAPGSGNATVCMEVSQEPAAVTLTFVDSGKPFDPTRKADPDVTLPAEERGIGGLGIFMTKKIMDDVKYAYRNGQNCLTMVKKL